MKKYKFILLTFVFTLFVNGSCEHQENQRFIVQNDSDKEIIVINSMYRSIAQDTSCFIRNMAKFEYEDFIYYRMIKPHSNKNFERIMWGESVISRPNDTLYLGVFYRADIDAMSCEEFKQEFPLKKEWKVTLSDMQAADWTLVYTPEE
jgi:hypothetical protein